MRHIPTDYHSLNIMRLSSCLAIGPVRVGSFTAVFGCAFGSLPALGTVRFCWLGPWLLLLLLGTSRFGG